MNIVVYFSVLCDTDEVLKSTWAQLGVENIDLGYASRIINPYDETAIEYALRIKDAAVEKGETVEITLFTLGEDIPSTITENLFAVGVDYIHCIEQPTFDFLNTEFQLRAVEQYLRNNSFDYFFMGQQNSYSCDSSLGVRLAARLGLPYVGYIADLHYDDGKLQVKRYTEKGFHSANVSSAAVFSFENTEHPYLRIATLRERLKTRGKTVVSLPAFSEEAQSRHMVLESFEYHPAVRKCVKIEGASVEEQATALLDLFCEEVADV